MERKLEDRIIELSIYGLKNVWKPEHKLMFAEWKAEHRPCREQGLEWAHGHPEGGQARNKQLEERKKNILSSSLIHYHHFLRDGDWGEAIERRKVRGSFESVQHSSIGTEVLNATTAGLGYLQVSVDFPCKSPPVWKCRHCQTPIEEKWHNSSDHFNLKHDHNNTAPKTNEPQVHFKSTPPRNPQAHII